jgi:hypothetical protein
MRPCGGQRYLAQDNVKKKHIENTGDITVMEKQEGEANMQVDNQRLAEI